MNWISKQVWRLYLIRIAGCVGLVFASGFSGYVDAVSWQRAFALLLFFDALATLSNAAEDLSRALRFGYAFLGISALGLLTAIGGVTSFGIDIQLVLGVWIGVVACQYLLMIADERYHPDRWALVLVSSITFAHALLVLFMRSWTFSEITQTMLWFVVVFSSISIVAAYRSREWVRRARLRNSVAPAPPVLALAKRR